MTAGTRLRGLPTGILNCLRNPVWLLVTAAAAPIVGFRHPPIMDVPNHLARIWLETRQPLPALLGQAYIIDWSRASSNILVDRVGAPLLEMIGLEAFWVLVTALMVLGPALAAIFLARHLNGRHNPWQALALSTAWGQSTVSGFLNYTLAIALALGFCLLNLKLARFLDTKLRCLIGALEVLAIYLTHPFGVALFFAFEFAMLIGPDVGGVRQLTPRRILVAFGAYAVMLLPTLGYIALHRSSSPLELTPIDYRGVVSHLVSLVSPFFAYDERVELALFAGLAGCCLVAVSRGRLTFHTGLLVCALMLGVLAMLIPDGIGHASLLTRRFPLMAALLLCIAARRTDRPGAANTDWFALSCALAILAHSGWIFLVWQQREADYRALVAVAKHIPPGSKVLVGVASVPAERGLPRGQYVHGFFIRTHLPALLVPLSASYIPTLFAIPGQQPLAFSAAFQPLQANLASIPTDADIGARTPPYAQDRYLEAWECHFDVVVIMKPDPTRAPLPIPHARLVVSEPFIDLLRVARPARCPGRP